jgi:hypothetical protein
MREDRIATGRIATGRIATDGMTTGLVGIVMVIVVVIDTRDGRKAGMTEVRKFIKIHYLILHVHRTSETCTVPGCTFWPFLGAVERPKLILKPRSVPKEVEQSNTPFAPSGRAASIFGGAKPVDTAAKEREVEERLKREQEKLQRQLEDRIPDRKPRERYVTKGRRA